VTRTPHACLRRSFPFPLTHTHSLAHSRRRRQSEKGAGEDSGALSERGKIARRKGSPPAVREMEGPFRYPPMSNSANSAHVHNVLGKCVRAFVHLSHPKSMYVLLYMERNAYAQCVGQTYTYQVERRKQAKQNTRRRDLSYENTHWHCHQPPTAGKLCTARYCALCLDEKED
jgi:hypothetical protein